MTKDLWQLTIIVQRLVCKLYKNTKHMKYIDLISHDSIVDSLLCKVTGTYEKKILTEFFEKKIGYFA